MTNYLSSGGLLCQFREEREVIDWTIGQDKVLAPHFSCSMCVMNLRAWLSGVRESMPFAIPMIQKEQNDNSTGCNFCTTGISGFTSRSKKCINYPNLNQGFVQFFIQKNWLFQNFLQTINLILIQSHQTKILCLYILMEIMQANSLRFLI